MPLDNILLGRFASLESDVPPEDDLEIESPEEGTDDTGAQLDGENIVEGDLVEAAEDAREVEDADDEAEDLEDTSDSLESFLIAAQIGKAKGGWTDGEALAYGLGIDVALKRIGSCSDSLMPSLESFSGSARERLEATASVENKIKDALIAIWDAIKRAVNKVVAFVRKWYVKIFDGASRLRKRAEAIRKKAENTQGTPKEKKLATSTLVHLNIGKTMPEAKTIAEGIKTMNTVVGNLTSSRLDKNYQTSLETLVGIITELADGKGKGSLDGAISKIAKLKDSKIFEADLGIKLSAASSDDAKRFIPVGIDGLTVQFHSSEVLPGNQRIGGYTYTMADQTDKRGAGRCFAAAMRSVNKIVTYDASNKKVEIDTTKEVKILEPNSVVHICNEVIDFCKTVVEYKLGFESYDKFNSSALSKIDSVVRKAGNNDEDRDNAEYVRGVAQGFGSIIRNRGTGITNAINLGMTMSRNALVYSVQSLALYK